MNQIFDRALLNEQVTGEILTFEVIPIKSFRSKYGVFVNTVVTVANSQNQIMIFDMSGNLLDTL